MTVHEWEAHIASDYPDYRMCAKGDLISDYYSEALLMTNQIHLSVDNVSACVVVCVCQCVCLSVCLV